MSKRSTKLAALAAEAAELQPPPPPAPDQGAPATAEIAPAAAPVPAPGHADMANICRLPVLAFGAAICTHYRVPALTADEAASIADSLALVLSVHGITVKDPRIVAWLTLGGSLVMAIQPRVELVIAANNARIAEAAAPIEAEPKPEADAAAA